MFEIIRFVAILLASVVVGNWFLSELKKARAQGKPIYQAYLTIPGILIIAVIIFLPILMWAIHK